MGSNTFIPGFEDQLVGCKADDEKDVEVTFPENYHSEELKGKPAVFKCRIHTVKETILPTMDDEFAKDVSETAETMEDLEKEVSERLIKSRADAADREFEEKLLDQVAAGMQAEIPEVMYENEATSLMNDFAYRLQMQGISIEQYLQANNMDMRGFRQIFLPQAERQVKIRLVLNKIAEMENIEISEDDINAEYAKLAERYGMEDEQVRDAITSEAVNDDLRLNRALAVIRDSAKAEMVVPKSNDRERGSQLKASAE